MSIQFALATQVCGTIHLIAHPTFYPLLVSFVFFRFFRSIDYLIAMLGKSRLYNTNVLNKLFMHIINNKFNNNQSMSKMIIQVIV